MALKLNYSCFFTANISLSAIIIVQTLWLSSSRRELPHFVVPYNPWLGQHKCQKCSKAEPEWLQQQHVFIHPLLTIQLTTIAVVNHMLERNERWPAWNFVPNFSRWAGGLMAVVRTWRKETFTPAVYEQKAHIRPLMRPHDHAWLFLALVFRCVLTSLKPGLSVRRSVGRSVCPSVRHAFVKTREINLFEWNIVRGGTVGPLDAPSHLYKTV